MDTTMLSTDALTILRNLTREQIEERLGELEAERQQLATLRRSMAAKERAKHRQRKGADDEE